jgi:hypothetical protein
VFQPILALSLSAIALAAPTTPLDCTRTFLQSATEQYFTAQTLFSTTGFTALSPTVTYTEDLKANSISNKTNILSHALKTAHNRSTYDTTACATYTKLIVTDAKNPHVIGTQMRFTGSQVTKMETLITQAGDWLFNATGTYYWASKEDWGTIDAAKQDSRTVI